MTWESAPRWLRLLLRALNMTLTYTDGRVWKPTWRQAWSGRRPF
jgi:hypothetical protein